MEKLTQHILNKEEAKYGIFGLDLDLFQKEPRDFKANLPVLETLGLENYDRNIFKEINIEEKVKELEKQWKVLDHAKIVDLMKYGVVQEAMRTEERKAVRNYRKGRNHDLTI